MPPPPPDGPCGRVSRGVVHESPVGEDGRGRTVPPTHTNELFPDPFANGLALLCNDGHALPLLLLSKQVVQKSNGTLLPVSAAYAYVPLPMAVPAAPAQPEHRYSLDVEAQPAHHRPN